MDHRAVGAGAAPAIDVLVVSVAGTTGWGTSGRELLASLRRAGARAEVVLAGEAPRVRTFALTDLTQAWAARRASEAGIAAHRPGAIIYCSITAALLWPRPGAIWLDCLATANRPGRHGVWQRPVERRRLAQAPLVMAMTRRALEGLPEDARRNLATVVLPTPVQGQPASGPRDIDAVTYAGDPVKRRLGLVLEAWKRVARPGETLVVAGRQAPQPSIPGVRFAGSLSAPDFRVLLGRAKVFIAAPRWEDFGIAALEALAHGCLLVTTPSPGPYAALPLAWQLDARLVGEDLAASLRIALDDPAPGYSTRAVALLTDFRRDAVDDRVAGVVLPRLLPDFVATRATPASPATPAGPAAPSTPTAPEGRETPGAPEVSDAPGRARASREEPNSQ